MTSRQRVVGERPTRASHFVQEVEMIPISHPPHKRETKSNRDILPPTYPGQDPVLRSLPASVASKYELDSKEELEETPRITADALRRLQDIVEAQKNFLKFQEMRNILLEARNTDSDKENSVTVSTGGSGRVRKVAKLRKSNDEKRLAENESRKRKSPVELTRQEQPSPVKTSRTQDTSVQTSVHEEEIPKSRKDTAVQTTNLTNVLAENEAPTIKQADDQEENVPNLNEGVECDWAYWYLPHSGTVRPARVTIRSRAKKSEENSKPVREEKSINDEKPWRKFMRKASEDRKESDDGKQERASKSQEKPWRANMKLKKSSSIEGGSKPVEEVKSKKAEKPWRVNMKKESSTERETASKLEDVPEPEPEVRPWRVNMKKEVEPPKPISPVVKKRHYDRKEVRAYIKSKKAKEREEKEEKEREETIRKQLIKSRLSELEKIQKQITESSSSELRSLSGVKEKEKKLSPEAEEALRMKLLELTEQMKEQWRERRERRIEREKSFSLAEEVYGKSNLTRDIDEININITSEPLDSSRKVSAKESLKVTNLVEEKQSLVESLPFQRSRLSSISDATEIRSLSDKLERSDRSGNKLERADDRSHKEKKSQVSDEAWSQRLFGDPLDCQTVLNNLSCIPTEAGHLSTPLTDEVPERDLSEAEGGGRLLAVKELYARHQEDLERIKAQVKEAGVETTPPPVHPEEFSPRFPSIITRSKEEQLGSKDISSSKPENTVSTSKEKNDEVDKGARRTSLPSPLPVPPPPAPEVSLPSGGESDGPPVWMEVTKGEDEDDKVVPPAGLHDIVTPTIDPFNFINTVARKYESASELQLSEGPLSSHLSSVSERSRDSSAVSSHYAKLSKERSESRRKESQSERSNSKSKMASDSESTLQGVEDTLVRDPPERQRRRRRKDRSKSLSSRTREEKSSHRLEDETPTSVVVRSEEGAGHQAGVASSLPSALHLRFLTELHQLESVTSTQQLLAELEQVKKFAFEHNQGLAEVQGEVARQRRLLEMQEGEDRVAQRQQQLQEMYTDKLAALLQSQSEATKVTSDVAKQLAKLTSEGQAGPVVRELQGLVEKLQGVNENQTSRSYVHTSSSKSTSTSISRAVESTSKVKEDDEDPNSDSKEETKATSRDDLSRGSSSSIQVDPMTFGSKTPSSILEVLDQNQAAGNSIQRTISEALASISEGDQRTRSSITAEVEEELSTDYSSQFEEESTLREQTLKTLLPSESQRRQSSSLLERRSKLRRDLSTASDSSIHFSEVEEEGATRPSSSLFSDNDSFTKFSLEMVSQYMMEEKVRAQHKASLLKIKEASLISEAKKKVEELEKIKKELVDKGKDDKMPKIKKKQRNILHKLKERRAEIATMRENLKVAERERRFMVEEQKRLLGKHKEAAAILGSSDSKKTKGAKAANNGDSADQESDAAEDPIAKIEVLKGLKRLDKSRKTMTSKERKFEDKKDLSGIFDTSRIEESGSEAMLSLTEEVETEIATPPSSTITVMSQNKSRSSSTSHRSVQRSQKTPNSQKSSTPKKSKPSHHSSAESEVESLGNLSHLESEAGTLSHLDTTPLTDNSDIEARIAALSDKLSNRMKTAARLKKEQRRERKEALRWQEDSLRKQIEKYDSLISEGRQEMLRNTEQAENLTKPIIKSPKSSKEKREDEGASSSLVTTPEVSQAEGSQSISHHSPQSSSRQSAHSISHQSASHPSNLISGGHESPSLISGSKASDQLSDSSGSAEVASSSTVLASPVKGSPAPPLTPLQQQVAASPTITSVEEDLPSSLPPSEEAAKYSSSFETQEEEKRSSRSSSSSSSRRGSENIDNRRNPNAPDAAEPETEKGDHIIIREKSINSVNQVFENKVDAVTESLWDQLVHDTIDEIHVEKFRHHPNILKSKEVVPETKNTEKVEVLKSPRRTHQRTISVTLKPQDLMLTTFDLNLTSPSSSDEASPLKKVTAPLDGEESGSDGKIDEVQIEGQEEFLDDDFGLSAIRQEAEILRLQQAKVEEEIARIAREAASAEAARIPDRPPPPYTAPTPPTPVKPAAAPPPPKPVVPNSKEQVLWIVNTFVEVLYNARKEEQEVEEIAFEPSLLCGNILSKLTSDLENEMDSSAVEQFLNMIWELTVDKVLVCYEHETLIQPPPWLPPLPLDKLSFLAPGSLEDLKTRVAHEVVKDLKLAPRVSREALMVRWSGKKRDRVDEILVRELQEEEALWTDYINEEAVVKQQMGDALLELLITDTANTFSAIFKRKHTKV